MTMYEKYEQLKQILASYERLIVAFSGGVDSTFLLKVAHDVLGDNVVAITAATPYVARWEIDEARVLSDHIGVKHLIIAKPWLDNIKHNPENRCYLCKHALFSALKIFAEEKGYTHIAEGSNVNDTREYRPGRQALQELNICTPLLEANLSKKEIRLLSKEIGLSSWNKPSYACLLTRFPYNQYIEPDALEMVDSAETYLIRLGYGEIRVRYENGLARLEMPHAKALDLLQNEFLPNICYALKSFGFSHVTIDLEGYRNNSPLNLSKESSCASIV